MVTPVQEASPLLCAYLFPGQGSQHVGMGKGLYEKYPEARKIFDHSRDVLKMDLQSICFKGPAKRLTETRFAQVAIFVVSMAAYEVLKNSHLYKKFIPKFMAGLSMGEATALVAAGAMSFEEGLLFIRDRGQFMDDASKEKPGMMAAVIGLTLEEVEKICAETGAEVGNLNSPGQVVISGEKAKVEFAIERAKKMKAKRVIALDVSGAFHSRCMTSACQRIAGALAGVNIKRPSVQVISNLTAEAEDQPDEIRKNLVSQMSHRTLWEASMRKMIASGIKEYFEIGPGTVLRGLMRRIDPAVNVYCVGKLEDFDALKG